MNRALMMRLIAKDWYLSRLPLTLIALAAGLLRQAWLSWENPVMAPAFALSSFLMLALACANLRFMLGRN